MPSFIIAVKGESPDEQHQTGLTLLIITLTTSKGFCSLSIFKAGSEKSNPMSLGGGGEHTKFVLFTIQLELHKARKYAVA